MLDFSEAPKGDLTIGGVVLEAAKIFDEGHVLSEVEASVLNQTRLENLRNNFAIKLKKFLDDAGITADKVSASIKATIQTNFDEFQEAYEFGSRGGRGSVDPVKRQAMILALGKVRDALKAKGVKLSSVSSEKMNTLAEDAIEKNPAFLKKAEKIVAAMRESAEELELDLNISAE